MTTPEHDVAQRIISRLRDDALLSEATLARISQRLVDGTMTADDWVHELERDIASGSSADDADR